MFEYFGFDERVDERVMLIAACIRCGVTFPSHPDTVPSVWINIETRCPIRTDGTAIKPGEPGTQREPLCDYCTPIMRAAAQAARPVLEVFPHARLDRITIPTETPGETA